MVCGTKLDQIGRSLGMAELPSRELDQSFRNATCLSISAPYLRQVHMRSDRLVSSLAKDIQKGNGQRDDGREESAQRASARASLSARALSCAGFGTDSRCSGGLCASTGSCRQCRWAPAQPPTFPYPQAPDRQTYEWGDFRWIVLKGWSCVKERRYRRAKYTHMIET